MLPRANIVYLAQQADIPREGTLSRTIYADDQIKVVLFAMDAGQELSEHTAAVPAIIEMIAGTAQLTLGREVIEATPGIWVHMPARLPHAILARTPMLLLLTLLRGASPGSIS
ncbi:MAG: cupin domain-containing protein [Chloroflexi bacterium]|nr:cupin domain-containing protein [Chloroflexota bacterium]